MKTIKYVAYGNCKVKVGGKEYSGTQVIPTGDKGLSEKDIERLLKDRFIRKLELDEDGTETKPSKPAPKKPSKPAEKPKTREELIAEAAGLGLMDQITEATTDEEIQGLIAEAQAK